jgi:hypothetical protein
MARSGSTILAAMLVAASLVFAAVPAYAAKDRPSEEIPGLQDSATIDGPAIIAGTLEHAGVAAPVGTLVTLYAWPNDDDMSRIQVGETVKKDSCGTNGLPGGTPLRLVAK